MGGSVSLHRRVIPPQFASRSIGDTRAVIVERIKSFSKTFRAFKGRSNVLHLYLSYYVYVVFYAHTRDKLIALSKTNYTILQLNNPTLTPCTTF